jgi:ubiquinone/menaquinone biosynthesis C-methylase UbiE
MIERANGEPKSYKMNKEQIEYTRQRISYWNTVADEKDFKRSIGDHYRQYLIKIYKNLVPLNRKVIELGCAEGDLLAALEPSLGVGVDFSSKMLDKAKEKYSKLAFYEQDAHELDLDEKFDGVILSDLVHDLWDVQKVFEGIRKICQPRTRVILNFYSFLWEKPFRVAECLKLIRPKLEQNWLTVEDVANLLYLADFEVVSRRDEYLWPFGTPVISELCNRYLSRLWPFKVFCLAHFVVARPKPQKSQLSKEPRVSVIVPARNEAGNIGQIFERTPEMGAGTELIFVEGGSKDDTYETIERAIEANPGRQSQLLRQTGVGKGDAVRLGFDRAREEVLMILDADLTVSPEDLPRFYETLRSGKGEFINGVRLVYPMEKRAMRFINLLGNKFFSLAFSWLLSQPTKDTLCGTKVLWRSDYELIVDNRQYFGDFDPFGDFDLLFGAAKLGLKIIDMPVRYGERTYGSTNISRWKHGWLLLRMVLFAARRIKFV